MNLRKRAVQLLIVLSFITAVPAANSQQGNLRGPKTSTPRYVEPQRQSQRQFERQPQTQRGAQSDTYGPIVSSDTLWQISQNHRPNRSLSIYQVMQAIYELNPEAFDQQNINMLKDGSILRMPSQSYISGVNRQQAQQKSELDSQNLQANSANQSARKTITNTTFEQAKELIEEKLGAIDETQTRQFMAIRKQFGQSINSVQSILDENKKLFERLGKVNTDIDEMRNEEIQKSLQMNQMGKSIEELLEKSRLDDAQRAAEIAQQNASWLNSPIMLVLLFTLPVLLALAGFAYWMIKRKSPVVVKPEEDDVDELSLDPIAAEMDDLSDALSAELSADETDELDDDNLFGDDDVLDDILADELQESLDDASEDNASDDSIEKSIIDDVDDIDDVDVGDDVLEDEFEVGTDVVEQDELDSLFEDDEDDLSAEISDDTSAGVSGDLADDLLADVQVSDENSDLDDMLIEDDKQQVDAEIDGLEPEEGDSVLAPVEVDEEQPEISIDELLDESADELVETPLTDDSEDMSENVLQNIDKEIDAQNEELDRVTGSLIDELEQVEQMSSMLPEDDEELSDVEEPQLDIQKLDGLAEDVDENLLADAFGEDDTDDTIEIDISEVLNETEQPVEADELIEPELEITESELEVAEPVTEPEPEITEPELEITEPEPEITEPELEITEPEPEITEPELEITEPELEITEPELEITEPELEVSEPEPEEPISNDSALDEDQLEKALEDFEKEELDEVLEDLTSNETASISSLDDLEFSVDDFVTKEQSSEPAAKSLPSLDDIESIEDFDDSELDNAFDETNNESANAPSQNDSDELDDLPGLGDWLGEDKVKPEESPTDTLEDDGIIEELEGSNFDEMLESIDLDDAITPADTEFDIAALLDETPQSEDLDISDQELEDFLDVEALLNESVGAESDDEIDKALDLDFPLEPFVSGQDDLDMIDVDADGLGAKLDLAHAYIEIGESESAKELLDEILQKGSTEQIAEVKTILEKLN